MSEIPGVSEPAIETRGLHKAYGKTVALESLDLIVGPGEVVGLLGPNGAGKTTAVKLLLGLVRKTRGEGRVLGRPLGDRGARAVLAAPPCPVVTVRFVEGEVDVDVPGDLNTLPKD